MLRKMTRSLSGSAFTRVNSLPSDGPPAAAWVPFSRRPGQVACLPSVRSLPDDGPVRRSAREHHRAAEGSPACWTRQQLDHLLAHGVQADPERLQYLAATPSPSRMRPSRMCSVPM